MDVNNLKLDGMELVAGEEGLALPLFFVRWKGASFVDISQSIGKLILETGIVNKRTGDYLYNLLFGYDVNDRYVKKISSHFGINFSRPYRAGIIAVDRTYGINLEQDEHIYEYYANCLNREVIRMKGRPMFMRFLNKFVLLFEAKENRETEREIENMLQKLDNSPKFKGIIRSTCILGAAYTDPRKYGQSYQEAKRLIPKKDLLPNPSHKKVLSTSSMGIYQFMFRGNDQREIKKMNGTRAFIISGPHLKKTGLVDMAAEKLKDAGIGCGTFTETEGNPSTDTLAAVGARADKIEDMARDAMKSGNIAVNPRTTTIGDVIGLYKKLL